MTIRSASDPSFDPFDTPTYEGIAPSSFGGGDLMSESGETFDKSDELGEMDESDEMVVSGHLTELGALVWADDPTALEGLMTAAHVADCATCSTLVSAAGGTVAMTHRAITSAVEPRLSVKDAAIARAMEQSITGALSTTSALSTASAKPNSVGDDSTPVISLADVRARKTPRGFTAGRWLAAAAGVIGVTVVAGNLVNRSSEVNSNADAAGAAIEQTKSAATATSIDENFSEDAPAETSAAAEETTAAESAAEAAPAAETSVAAETVPDSEAASAFPAEEQPFAPTTLAAPPINTGSGVVVQPTPGDSEVVTKDAPTKPTIPESTERRSIPPTTTGRLSVVPTTRPKAVPVPDDTRPAAAPPATTAPAIPAQPTPSPSTPVQSNPGQPPAGIAVVNPVSGAFASLADIVALLTKTPGAFEGMATTHPCSLSLRTELGAGPNTTVRYAEVTVAGVPVVIGVIQTRGQVADSTNVAGASPSTIPTGPVGTSPGVAAAESYRVAAVGASCGPVDLPVKIGPSPTNVVSTNQ